VGVDDGAKRHKTGGLLTILNFLLCSGVLATFVYLGFRIRRGFKTRRDFFGDAVRFCDHLTTEINFSKNTVEQVIRRYIGTYNLAFAELLLKYSHLLASNSDITRDALKEFIAHDDVADFFLQLGKHSSAEELEKIKAARSRFQSHLTGASEKLAKEATIYFKICIIIGVGVVILLI